MFYPKLGSPENELYIINAIPDPGAPDILDKQLKQCRNGFYDFSSHDAIRVMTETDFAVKSAYDRDKRRSKDTQMFGYQSLQRGITMYFSVEADDNIDIEPIREALVGRRNIGRSRSAQYGLVEISEENYKEVESSDYGDGLVMVYADSRLIFLDNAGNPTFRPDAAMLGIDGEIDWEKSQIRTFRYAPWNFKRQCFDTDRCGFEKGSVFAVHTKNIDIRNLSPRYIGAYRNEGFGRVIYNPEFLKADTSGVAVYRLINKVESLSEESFNSQVNDFHSPLIDYLLFKKNSESEVYTSVNNWVNKNGKFFKGESFSSQWGKIRSMATAAESFSMLKEDLFREKYGYLVHGVAKDKWEEKNRIGRLREFIETLNDSIGREAVVNLAAEMAKLCNASR